MAKKTITIDGKLIIIVLARIIIAIGLLAALWHWLGIFGASNYIVIAGESLLAIGGLLLAIFGQLIIINNK
ncbi:MAG: hypothetical protein ORN57_04195 [Alphaproteobacteria bacterium]|nr:hypothetical protein [Alphaproteobacteria bacterium]